MKNLIPSYNFFYFSEFGRQNDCKFIKVIATSYFTCLALERLGFTQIFTINYKDYKVNGEVIFKTDPPHISLGVYLKNIWKSSFVHFFYLQVYFSSNEHGFNDLSLIRKFCKLQNKHFMRNKEFRIYMLFSKLGYYYIIFSYYYLKISRP